MTEKFISYDGIKFPTESAVIVYEKRLRKCSALELEFLGQRLEDIVRSFRQQKNRLEPRGLLVLPDGKTVRKRDKLPRGYIQHDPKKVEELTRRVARYLTLPHNPGRFIEARLKTISKLGREWEVDAKSFTVKDSVCYADRNANSDSGRSRVLTS